MGENRAVLHGQSGAAMVAASKMVLIACSAYLALAVQSASGAVANLSTVTSVYQSDWSSSTTGWSGTTAIRTQDRRGNTIPASMAVGDTVTSSVQTAISPTLPAGGADGSFRLSFVVQFDNSGSFSTNWGDVYLYNSQTNDNWQIRIQQVSADGSSGVVMRRNGNTFTGSTAAFSFATGAVSGVGRPVMFVVERDGETNAVRVYASYNLNAELSSLTPIISTTNSADIGGIDQIRIAERDTGNKRLYSSVTLATNPVPEAASLGILGLAGCLFLRRSH